MNCLSLHSFGRSRTQLDSRILENPEAEVKRTRHNTVSVTVTEPKFIGVKRPGIYISI